MRKSFLRVMQMGNFAVYCIACNGPINTTGSDWEELKFDIISEKLLWLSELFILTENGEIETHGSGYDEYGNIWALDEPLNAETDIYDLEDESVQKLNNVTSDDKYCCVPISCENEVDVKKGFVCHQDCFHFLQAIGISLSFDGLQHVLNDFAELEPKEVYKPIHKYTKQDFEWWGLKKSEAYVLLSPNENAKQRARLTRIWGCG
jgi:hypothetical protein